MKTPYLDFNQRENIKMNTTLGAFLKCNIEIKKLTRELDRTIIKIIDYVIKK